MSEFFDATLFGAALSRTRQRAGDVDLPGLAGMVVAVGALLWVRAQRKVRRAAPSSDATRDEGGW